MALVAVGAVVFVLMRRRSEPARAAEHEKVARLEAEVATLKRQIDAEQAAPALPRASGAASAGPQKSHFVPRTPEEKRAWIRARGAFYTSQVKAEKRDDVWASRIEQEARRLAQLRPTVKIETVDCRTTLCLMRFGYPTQQARQAHLSSVPGSIPDLPRVAFEYANGEHGEVEAVLYSARLGHSLPDFDWQPTTELH